MITNVHAFILCWFKCFLYMFTLYISSRRPLQYYSMNVFRVIFHKRLTLQYTCVRWKDHVSSFFRLNAGVRRDGVLSPLVFAMFMDDLISRVESANAGYYLSFSCCYLFTMLMTYSYYHRLLLDYSY